MRKTIVVVIDKSEKHTAYGPFANQWGTTIRDWAERKVKESEAVDYVVCDLLEAETRA